MSFFGVIISSSFGSFFFFYRAKVSDKIQLVSSLLDKVDHLIIGEISCILDCLVCCCYPLYYHCYFIITYDPCYYSIPGGGMAFTFLKVMHGTAIGTFFSSSFVVLARNYYCF